MEEFQGGGLEGVLGRKRMRIDHGGGAGEVGMSGDGRMTGMGTGFGGSLGRER